MTSVINKSSQKIQEALLSYGVNTTIKEFDQSTRTALEAATAIGCSVEQIVKSLIFRIKGTDKALLLLVSGPNRVNEKKIESITGHIIEKADADFTRQVTGFAIGGIPPLGHPQPIETYIDQDLLNLDILWAAAGTPHTVFSLTPEQLVQITNGTVIAVK